MLTTDARYAIEPQRDVFKSLKRDETRYEKCAEQIAEIWAVFHLGEPDAVWLADFPSRGLAEQYLKQLGILDKYLPEVA